MLERGTVRAAERGADGTWRAVPWVKRGILVGFRAGRMVDMSLQGLAHRSAFHFGHPTWNANHDPGPGDATGAIVPRGFPFRPLANPPEK